jgi:FSR family fosmidomycin resistance protein-like MFS transporter
LTSASSVSEPDVRVQKKKLSSLVVAHIANDSFFGFLPPILPLLVVQMSLTDSLAALLASTFALTGAVGQPLFGYFSDRVRKGWLIALGPILGGLMTLLVYMPNYPAMLLLLLFAGIGSACFHPVASVIAAQISGNRKGFGVSVYVSGGRLGVGLGAAGATFIVTNWGLEAIPIGGAIGILIGIPYLFFAPSIESGPAGAAAMNFRETLQSLKSVGRPLILMWFVNLSRTTVTMTVGTFMPLYIVRGGGSIGEGGWAITLFLFAAAAGGIYGGHLSDRIGRRTVMIVGMLIGTPVLGASFLVGGISQIALLMASGAILYAPMGVSVTYAQEVSPDHKALVSSFMLGVVWFFASIIVIGVGALSDLIGLSTVLPLTCVAVGGIGAILAFALPRSKSEG